MDRNPKPSLKHGTLTIICTIISIEMLDESLSKMIHRSVEELEIENTYLTNQHFEVITKFIRRSSSLRDITIRDLPTTISATSMRMLTDAIMANRMIKSLTINGFNVENITIAENAFPILENFIRRTRYLRYLNLNGSKLNSVQFARICRALHDNRRTTSFNSTNQNIVADDIQHVAHLTSVNTTLRKIDISFNENLGDDCIPHITNIFQNNRVLHELHIGYIGLTKDGTNAIIKAMDTSKTNMEVFLEEENEECTKTMEEIMEMIASILPPVPASGSASASASASASVSASAEVENIEDAMMRAMNLDE